MITKIEYGAESDFWSVGVTAFVLLSGEMPFTDEDQLVLFDSITKCEWSFQAEIWQIVSQEAKDFISEILVEDPKKRLDLAGMAVHPWIKMNQDNSQVF